ncbi:MAG: hypothetical protein LQ349_004208 [Xanthoria aureola]|nr:MAG: hypothetical protein LQ349_004208 [Xanthoria aureola]
MGNSASVHLVARGRDALHKTHDELLLRRRDPKQNIKSHSVDLTNAAAVDAVILSLSPPPSILFCVAGGASGELGFFADLTPTQLHNCFNKNYFSAALITHSLLRRWLKEPIGNQHQQRHIVFTASTAAFVAVPGYAAYTPAKAALRALADIIRHEVLMYPQDVRVHCSFPGTIFTDSFYEEQRQKPALTKQIEGSDNPTDGMTAGAVSKSVFAGLSKDHYLITTDYQTWLLLNNMRGPSPPNNGILEWLVGLVASLVWPIFRLMFDRQTRQSGSHLSALKD